MSKEHSLRREIASITKIMTCYLVLKYTREAGLDIECFIPVSQRASTVGGTSARLEPGEEVQIWDLLHGLMLPSGNDAAMCLGEYFGRFLALEYGDDYNCEDPLKYFVKEMNLTAHNLGLNNTHYTNPHGMSKPKNFSSVKDICQLAAIAMKDESFKTIVGTSRYSCYILNPENFQFRKAVWQNTNELLGKGFEGVKTGVTKNAGPCLCAFYRKKRKSVVVVVLGSVSREQRWTDVPKLADHGIAVLDTYSS